MQEKVKTLLTTNRDSRDNDFYVLYWIWKDEFEAIDANQGLSVDFDKTNIVNILSLLKQKELSHPSAIMRARRKIQESHESLRGEIWNARHAEQANVRKDLGYSA
jgi:hypothetical protein